MKDNKAHGGTGKKSHHHPTTDLSKPSWMSGVQHRHLHGTHDAEGTEMKTTGKCKGSGKRVVARSITNPQGFCLVCRQRMVVSDLRGRWVQRACLPAVPKLEGTLPEHDMRIEA